MSWEQHIQNILLQRYTNGYTVRNLVSQLHLGVTVKLNFSDDILPQVKNFEYNYPLTDRWSLIKYHVMIKPSLRAFENIQTLHYKLKCIRLIKHNVSQHLYK